MHLLVLFTRNLLRCTVIRSKIQGFIFKKTVVFAVMVWYDLNAEITIKDLYKKCKYKMLNFYIQQVQLLLLLLPGAELSLIAGSFDLLTDLLLPFLSILDASCPISDLHLANVLFDVILPSVLGSSL